MLAGVLSSLWRLSKVQPVEVIDISPSVMDQLREDSEIVSINLFLV